jgi:hypothetical protein
LKRFVVPVLFITIAFVSSACAGGTNQYPPTIPPRQITAAPTIPATATVAIPTPDTNIPTATIDPNLPTATTAPTLLPTTVSSVQSGGGAYTTRDGHLSFTYPQNWFVLEVDDGEFILSNNQSALSSRVPSAGQYLINIIMSPIEELPLGSADAVQTTLSVQEVLVQLAQNYQVTGTEVTDPVEESVGGRTMYFVRITNATTEALLGIADINGTHIAIGAVAVRGELNLLEPIARTVAASLAYTP